MQKSVYIYHPGSKGQNSQGYLKHVSEKDIQSVYKAMEFILTFPDKLRSSTEQFPPDLLSDIINLHDASGIKNPPLIASMVKSLRAGGELVNKDKIPNVRITRTTKGKWVAFDGHHSLLAYLFVGKKYLQEIPHMIILNNDSGFITDTEMSEFFGPHSQDINKNNWFNYVINWQAPKSQQIVKRTQKNMQELFNTFRRMYQELID